MRNFSCFIIGACLVGSLMLFLSAPEIRAAIDTLSMLK